MEETLQSLKLTSKETRRFEEALKEPEFLKLFEQYARDIASPEARNEQDCYLRQLESEAKVEEVYGKGPQQGCQLVIPREEFVFKTKTRDGKKVFVNVCSSDKLRRAEVSEAQKSVNGRGAFWDIPYAIGSLYETQDKQSVVCKGVDFVVHPETIKLSLSNLGFYKILVETAVEQLNALHNFGVASDVVRLEMKYKASEGRTKPGVLSIRSKPRKSKTLSKEGSPSRSESADTLGHEGVQMPPYKIVYSHDMDISNAWSDMDKGLKNDQSRRPKGLRVEIPLEKVKSISEISLDVKTSSVSLNVEGLYALSLDLPMTVDESKAKAEFDQLTKILKIKIPVQQQQQPFTSREELKRSSSFKQSDPEKEAAWTPPSFASRENSEMARVLLNEGTDDSLITYDAFVEETLLEKEEVSTLTPNEKKWREVHETNEYQICSSNNTTESQGRESKNLQQDKDRADAILSNLDLDSIMSID